MKGGVEMNTRKTIAAVSFIFLISTAVLMLPMIYTSKELSHESPPPSYQISDPDNHIDYQDGGLCGAYAAAYVMRHFGSQTSAEDLSPSLQPRFGFTSPNSVARLLKENGYDAKAYHGTLADLKARVAKGDPVIVYIRIPHDTHYAVVTGYDEDHIFLADSLRENANSDTKDYNRQVETAEFKELWKTATLLDNNIYIAVNKKR